MTTRPDNPMEEAPAAWALWQWVVARLPAEEVNEFAEVMRNYRDEVHRNATSEAAVRELTPQQVSAIHSLTGRILWEEQSKSWRAAGLCGVCGFDGDRTGCTDCGLAASATQASAPTTCPSQCDTDCGETCHEAHQPHWKRGHDPDDCPGRDAPRRWRPLQAILWPSWAGKPLPSMQETGQQVLNDLAERGIRLVVPGFDTPPEPTWPYGLPRGDWITLFEREA